MGILIIIFETLMMISLVVLGLLFYFLNKRLEKLGERTMAMVQWCDTLRENEETIMNDFKRLRHEFQTFQKEHENRG